MYIALSEKYKNLLTHMNWDDASLLLELFGSHRLQWLEHHLDLSLTGETDSNLSIISELASFCLTVLVVAGMLRLQGLST